MKEKHEDLKESNIYDNPINETRDDLEQFNPCTLCPMAMYCSFANPYADEDIEDFTRQYYKPKNKYMGEKYSFPFMFPYMNYKSENEWNEYPDEYSEED